MPAAPRKKQSGRPGPSFNPTTNVLAGPSGDARASKNLDGFVQNKGLVIGTQVNYGAKDRQQQRAEELRDMLQLAEAESFNLFEMAPKLPMDLYQERLAAGAVNIGVTSIADDQMP